MAQFNGPGGPWKRPDRHPPAEDTVPRLASITPASGRVSGGTSVTIRGFNFRYLTDGTAPTVEFDGIPATGVVVVDANTITAITPADSEGAVDVTVTIETQTGTLFGAFTYISSAITKIEPNFGPFGGGTTVLITGYNFVAGSTVTFAGNAATGVIFIDAQHIQAVTPSHATGFVDVVVTEPGGDFDTFQNGFQYTLLTRGEDIRRTPGITISDVLNNTPNSCSFLVDGTSNQPALGEKIEITDPFDGDRLLFAGTVVSSEMVYEGQIDQLAWRVTCADWTFQFNKKRPFGTYVNVSASLIAIDLADKFAPGFTTNHIQTNLAKVTITFDGSEDMATAYSRLAQHIGGGHWYIDYNQDVHFFHIEPPFVADIPPSAMAAVGATAMTIAQDGQIASTSNYFTPGWYWLRSTTVYQDGTESAFSDISNVVYFDGTKQLSITSLPLGSVIGTLTPVSRRIYYNLLTDYSHGQGNKLEDIRKFAEVGDNTTTAFTTNFGANGASVATVTSIADTVIVPVPSMTGHPVGPANAPTLGINTVTGANFASGTAAQVKVAFLFRNGAVSFVGPASNTAKQFITQGVGIDSFSVSNIPTGDSVNGLDVVARLVYLCSAGLVDDNIVAVGPPPAVWPSDFNEPNWSPEWAALYWVVPDNTTTSFTSQSRSSGVISSTSEGQGAVNDPYDNSASNNANNPELPVDPIPMWPNPDGPSLENTQPPDDITNDNPDLLHEDSGSQPFCVYSDITQVRNRVFILGGGSNLVTAGAVGDTQLQITDWNFASRAGGTVKCNGQVFDYTGLLGVSAAMYIKLAKPLEFVLPAGAPIQSFFQADDTDSQKLMGSLELDKDGNPTDGVHEYTIVDTTLRAKFQFFMRAHAELELFAFPIVTVRYATRDPNSKSGSIVHVDMDNPPCQGDFLIQEVQIDQIHDESDQLSPRYTVSASSVRYELNDLLLSILQNGLLDSSSAGGGGGVSGATTGAGVSLSVDSGNSIFDSTRRHWGLVTHAADSTGVVPTFINLNQGGNWSNPGGTGSTRVDSRRRHWLRMPTNTTPGNLVEVSSGQSPGVIAPDWDPIAKVAFRTGPSLIGSRWFIGFFKQSDGNGDKPNNTDSNWANIAVSTDRRAAIAFRYSHPAGDSGFRAVTSDGKGTVIAPTGNYADLAGKLGAFETNTEYLLTLSVSHVDHTATFTMEKVADSSDTFIGTSKSVTLTVPTLLFGNGLAQGNANSSACPMYWVMQMIYNSGVAVSIDFGEVFLQWGLDN